MRCLISFIISLSFICITHASDASNDGYEFIPISDEYGQEIIYRRRIIPTLKPSKSPTNTPTYQPSLSPTRNPTTIPSSVPTKSPTEDPTKQPTNKPTKFPTTHPTSPPTSHPTEQWDSKGSPIKQKSKLSNKDRDKDSKLLKQASLMAKEAQLKTSKSKLDTIELYTYHSNLTRDGVAAFEDKINKNADSKYNLIILEGSGSDHPNENVLTYVTALDKALYHQINFLHRFRKGEFSEESLFRDGVVTLILLIAQLHDQSIYDSIVNDIYGNSSSSEYNPNPTGSKFDGVVHFLLTEHYQTTRKELRKSMETSMAKVAITSDYDSRSADLILLIFRIIKTFDQC